MKNLSTKFLKQGFKCLTEITITKRVIENSLKLYSNKSTTCSQENSVYVHYEDVEKAIEIAQAQAIHDFLRANENKIINSKMIRSASITKDNVCAKHKIGRRTTETIIKSRNKKR